MKLVKIMVVTLLVFMLGMPSYPSVKAETQIDVKAPEILAVTANKVYVAPGEKITFSMDVKDDSAFHLVYVSIEPKNRDVNPKMVTLKYNAATGKCEGTYVVPTTAFNERWQIYSVSASDIHGNETYSYIRAKDWKYTTEFVIFDGNDTVKPMIKGMFDQTIGLNSEFDMLKNVTAFDEIDGDITGNIGVVGTVDTTKIGDYPLTYAVSDKAGNRTEVERIISVRDLEKPVLSGVRDMQVYIEEDEPNLLKGISAYDNWDKDLTDKVVVSGIFDLKKKGTYNIQYSVTDSSGNTTVQKAKLLVAYYGIQTMTEGLNDVKLLVNDQFEPLAGVLVYDTAGNNFTGQLQIEGQVDTSKEGSYKLIYTFKDAINRVVKQERTVQVFEKKAPTFEGVGDVTIVEGTEFIPMQGVYGVDSFGDRIDSISASYSGSINEVGTHEVYYEVTDRWNQTIKHTRTVTVLPKTPHMVFTDVLPTHMYNKEITAMKEAGIITGYPDGSFKPDTNIKRQHVAALIDRAVKLTPIRPATTFSDVPTTHPYYKEIQALYRAGVIDGTAGKFRPDEELTRAQLAKILVNAFNLKQGNSEPLVFKDIQDTAWEKEYVTILSSNNITTGDGGYFKPQNKVTRMHYAVFMSRALQQ